MRAFVLALALGGCALQDPGLAGCFDRLADGRIIYRPTQEPSGRGLCQPMEDLQSAQALPKAPCGTACRLRLDERALR